MPSKKHCLKDELYSLIQNDESMFEFLQSVSQDGIWYWDLENRDAEWMSPRFWELLGYGPEEKEHLVSELDGIVDPEDLKAAQQNLKKHCADPNHPYDQIVRYRHKDGSTVWFRSQGAAIRDAEGKPTRMLVTHTDLTQIKDAENEAARKAIELNEARLEAERANRAKSAFLSSMSHELRTPLNGILGFSELLHEKVYGELNERQTEYVTHIRQSGEVLLELITDLLDISKAEMGVIELDREPLSVRNILRFAFELVSTEARSKDVRINIEVDGELVVRGDRLRCAQVMMNLMSNAIKFSPRYGIVEVRAATQGDSHVRITVDDQGAGLLPGEQHKIFSDFYQPVSTRSSAPGSSGIGLALAKKLVELQGGEIGMESGPEKGNRFWVTFPVWEGGTPIRFGCQDQDLQDRPVERKILIADDDALSIRLLLDILSEDNHYIVVAKNGNQVLEAVNDFDPEIIFMDMQMPVMDGYETTRRLRKMDEFRTVPIVALTASASAENIANCLAAGCDAHLPKPIRSRTLFQSIKSELVKKRDRLSGNLGAQNLPRPNEAGD